MGFVEQRVFRRIPFPAKYHRYIDDTFIVTETRAALDSIHHAFGDSSVLNFTFEFPLECALPFLDVKVKQNSENFTAKVYRKPTNISLCLNGDSECPEKYKSSVIAAYMKRAITHCSSWNDVHHELDFMAQQLVDNGYTSRDINRIRHTLNQ